MYTFGSIEHIRTHQLCIVQPLCTRVILAVKIGRVKTGCTRAMYVNHKQVQLCTGALRGMYYQKWPDLYTLFT